MTAEGPLPSGLASADEQTTANAASLIELESVFAPGEAARLIGMTEATLRTHCELIEQRGRAGFVRRLHGDLHLEVGFTRTNQHTH